MLEESQTLEPTLDASSLESLFLDSQESYDKAQQRSQEENRSFTKTEFFRMDKYGVYRLRILPLAPNADGSYPRQGYEYPTRRMILELARPETSTSKNPKVYVTVTRATDCGYSVDLIDTYRHLAIQAAKEKSEDELAEKIDSGSFGGGLRYNFGHAMYVYDLSDRNKGIQLLSLSHAQFKELDERKFKLWQKKLSKNPLYPCPISSIRDAYPVEIEKRKNGQKTEYIISIDNEADTDRLTHEELGVLMNSPRVPEVINRYTRYHYEATIEFLKQCDVTYGLDIMSSDQMTNVIQTLGEELPREDVSSFSFERKESTSTTNVKDAVTLDELLHYRDVLNEKGLSDKTEEGQELRRMIREYIEQENLPIRVTRLTTNQMLLEMLEENNQA